MTVKEILLHREMTITRFAARLGFARNTVSRTINHPAVHPRVRRSIERDLKLEAVK